LTIQIYEFVSAFIKYARYNLCTEVKICITFLVEEVIQCWNIKFILTAQVGIVVTLKTS